jgi:hypothetical protein
MSIIRIKKEREYVSIANAILQNKNLTWEARGIMAYLLSKPDGWECRNYDLVNQGPAGKHIIQRVLKELQKAGYIHRYQKSDGHKIEWVTEIYETPELNTASRNTDFPPAEEPTGGNPDGRESGDIVSTDPSKDLSQKKLNGGGNPPTPPQPEQKPQDELDLYFTRAGTTDEPEDAALRQIETVWQKRIAYDTKLAMVNYYLSMQKIYPDTQIPRDKSTQGKWAAGAKDHLDNYSLGELKTLYPKAIKHARDRDWDIYSPQSLTSALAKVKVETANGEAKGYDYETDQQWQAFGKEG